MYSHFTCTSGLYKGAEALVAGAELNFKPRLNNFKSPDI